MFSIKSRIINNMGFAGCVWSLSHIVLFFFFLQSFIVFVFFFFKHKPLGDSEG